MEDRVDAEACVTRLLARRNHSTGELRTKLGARGFSRELIDDLVDDLVDRGWVDDRKFAAHQARILVDRGWGPIQIKKKLVKHGVGRALAASAIDDLGVDWVEAARTRAERKFGELGAGDVERAFRHLTHRGFSKDMARRALFD